jgi:hypothetical protein
VSYRRPSAMGLAIDDPRRSTDAAQKHLRQALLVPGRSGSERIQQSSAEHAHTVCHTGYVRRRAAAFWKAESLYEEDEAGLKPTHSKELRGNGTGRRCRLGRRSPDTPAGLGGSETSAAVPPSCRSPALLPLVCTLPAAPAPVVAAIPLVVAPTSLGRPAFCRRLLPVVTEPFCYRRVAWPPLADSPPSSPLHSTR